MAPQFEPTPWDVPLEHAHHWARVPVPLLRWLRGHVHCHSGDRSVYGILDALWRGDLALADIEPLEVVLDGREVWSLSSQRLAALKMLQALRGHVLIWVRCVIRGPDHPRFHAAMTTHNCGLGVEAT